MPYIVVIAIFLFFVTGWVMNIITLINAGPVAAWTVMEVFRVIGIFFAPLGSLLGWF